MVISRKSIINCEKLIVHVILAGAVAIGNGCIINLGWYTLSKLNCNRGQLPILLLASYSEALIPSTGVTSRINMQHRNSVF